MASRTEARVNQVTEENNIMEETITKLEEKNSKLQHKIRLMEIQQSHDEAVIGVLKKHIEERRALNNFLWMLQILNHQKLQRGREPGKL